jgi:hypothetical protein
MTRIRLTESEKDSILFLYKSKNLLKENPDVSLPPTIPDGGGGSPTPPPTTTYDVPMKSTWPEAKDFIMSKPDSVSGYWPDPNPEYEFAKYLDSNGNYMEIKSNGRAQEADPQFKLVHKGTWKWNGSEVIFSWKAKNKVTNDVWSNVSKRLKDTMGQDYNDFRGSNINFTDFEEGEWGLGGYKYAKVYLTNDKGQNELELRDNFTWVRYNRKTDDLKFAGKWSWDGSKINFEIEKSLKDTKILDENDKDLYIALFLKDKIGKRGAKGPAVKELQQLVTPDDNQDYGTGQGCKSDKNKCDGKYGPKTAELVKKLQEDSGAKIDGIFGKETYRAAIEKSDEIGYTDID